MADFATLSDVSTLTGKTYTTAEGQRITALLPYISAALRVEAQKVGKDLDAMIAADTTGAYGQTVTMVTVDIAARVMRQSQDGDPMTQETQSALGYSWSGTYAVPGGGIAGCIMRNDLKRLGLRRQQYGVMETWEPESTE